MGGELSVFSLCDEKTVNSSLLIWCIYSCAFLLSSWPLSLRTGGYPTGELNEHSCFMYAL